MANIFFGRGKKKTLVIESSDMGLKALSLEVSEESISIEKSFFSPWSLFLSQNQEHLRPLFSITSLQKRHAACTSSLHRFCNVAQPLSRQPIRS